MRLAHLEKAAQDAHRWLSHDPDKMGTYYVREYSQLLDSDENELRAAGKSEEAVKEYSAKFENLFKCWISRISRCSNWFITGGANYNVRRNEKARNSERKASDTFHEWRKKVLKMAGKAPKLSMDEKLQEKRGLLIDLFIIHERVKETNKLWRKGYTIDGLLALGHSQEDAEFLTSRYRCKLSTQNSLAKIKACEEALRILEAKIDAREVQKTEGVADNQKVQINGGIAYLDFEIDRIVIKHDTKPSQSIIDLMKKNTFKWSPKNSAWIRQITPNAKSALRNMLKQGL